MMAATLKTAPHTDTPPRRAAAMPPADYFPALTGVRALAAYAVFNYHFNSVSATWFGETLYRLSYEMYLGVNVFYVLSGFLIYYRYADDLARPSGGYLARYARNRFARIYPVYFLFLTLTFLWGYSQTGAWPDLRTTLATYTLTQAFFPDLVSAGIPQAWTLTIEETFYFLAPLIFLLARRYSVVLPCVLFVSLAQLLGRVAFPGNPYHGHLGHLLGRTLLGTIVCFSSGILLAQIIKRNPAQLNRHGRPLVTYGALAVGFLVILLASKLGQSVEAGLAQGEIGRGRDHPWSWWLLFVVFPLVVAAWFYGLLTERSLLRRALASPLFVLLGGSSYCFYLIHLGVVQQLVFRALGDDFVNAFPALTNGLLFVALILISIGVFEWFEKPVGRWIKGERGPSRQSDPIYRSLTLDQARRLFYLGLAVVVVLLYAWPHFLYASGRNGLFFRLLDEDGPYESLEAVLCLAGALLFAVAAWHSYAKKRSQAVWLALLALMLLFMLGEEISWGQRLLGFRTPAPLARINRQGEFSLHNIGWFQPQDEGNRLQNIWLLAMFAYLGLLPPAARWFAPVRRLVDRVGLPLASLPLSLLFLASAAWYVAWPLSSEILEAVINVLLVAFAVEVYLSATDNDHASSRAWRRAIVAVPTLMLTIVLAAQAGQVALPTRQSQDLTKAAEQKAAAGHVADAKHDYQRAIELWPHNVDARFQLATIAVDEGDNATARAQLEEVLRLNPDYLAARVQLGRVYAQLGETSKAIGELRRANRAQPETIEIATNLAVLLATADNARDRDGAEAIRLAENALRRCDAPQQPLVLNALAAAYAEQGRFDEAVATARRGIESARAQGQQPLVTRLEQRLERYEALQPARQTE